MSSSEEQAVREKLVELFRAMRAWEERCNDRYKAVKRGELTYSEGNAQNLVDLQELHRRHCTTPQGTLPERNGTLQRPPEYDPEGEKILQVQLAEAGDEAIVVTQQTTAPHPNKCVYTLRRTSDGWRVVDNRVRETRDGQLTPWPL